MPKKIVFVCLGNICRSPMAEFVMKSMTDQLHIESRATSTWEHGNPVHPGTQKIFKTHHIPFDGKKSSQHMTAEDFYFFDEIYALDEQNLSDLRAAAPKGTADKICLLLDKAVPDPYYTGDFEETYRLVKAGCEKILEQNRLM